MEQKTFFIHKKDNYCKIIYLHDLQTVSVYKSLYIVM